MKTMQRAHQIRKERSYQLQSLSYREQMSFCLKAAHKENALRQYNEKLRAKSIARLEQQKKDAAERMRRAQEEMKNKKPFQPKTFSELDFAKGAFEADQRDKQLGLKVRGW